MFQFVVVVQSLSRVWLCNPMDNSTSDFPVLHCLPELAQTLVHLISDAIQRSHPLSSPSPAFNLSKHQGLFQWVNSLHQVAKVLELQHQSFWWVFRVYFLGLTGLISLQSEGLLSPLQHHNWKASTLSCLALFMAQFSHLYITTGKTIALTIQTFVVYFNKGLKMQNCTKCAIMNKNVQIYTHKMWYGMLDCQYPLNHQKAREFQKNIYFCLTWLRQSLWLCGSQTVENSLRDGNTRPPDLPLEKSVCGSRSDS